MMKNIDKLQSRNIHNYFLTVWQSISA